MLFVIHCSTVCAVQYPVLPSFFCASCCGEYHPCFKPPSAPQPECSESLLLVLQDKQAKEQRSLVFVDNQCLPKLAISQICGGG